MPEVDFTRAKRIVRRNKGRERVPLRAVREAVGKTQVEVAEAAGIPQGDVSRLESRVALGVDLRVSSLSRYARALGGALQVAIVIGDRRFLVDVGERS
jgi:transcriptional regulator with XRE-family HTH domain